MRTQEFINHQILQKELISHTVFIEDGWTSRLSKVKPDLMTRFITLQILFMLFTKHIGKCVISFIYNARDLHVQLNGLWMWFPHSRQKLLVWFFQNAKQSKQWLLGLSVSVYSQGVRDTEEYTIWMSKCHKLPVHYVLHWCAESIYAVPLGGSVTNSQSCL